MHLCVPSNRKINVLQGMDIQLTGSWHPSVTKKSHTPAIFLYFHRVPSWVTSYSQVLYSPPLLTCKKAPSEQRGPGPALGTAVETGSGRVDFETLSSPLLPSLLSPGTHHTSHLP